jgi:predicted RNA-binding Zn-ribbon protein involved in translation (DUF1610 family)
VKGGKAMLRGQGHVGSFCPNCGEELEYRKCDVSGVWYWEKFQCVECSKIFVMLFKAIEWEEEREKY